MIRFVITRRRNGGPHEAPPLRFVGCLSRRESNVLTRGATLKQVAEKVDFAIDSYQGMTLVVPVENSARGFSPWRNFQRPKRLLPQPLKPCPDTTYRKQVFQHSPVVAVIIGR